MLLFSSSSSSVITEISTDYKTLGSVAVVLALSQAEALVEPTVEMLPIPAWNRLQNMNLAHWHPYLRVIPAPAHFSGSAGIGSTTRAYSK